MSQTLSVVLGALIALASSLIVEWRTSRRALRQRWDTNRLDAVGEFINASNRAIGALFDEGRSRGERRPDLPEKDRDARLAMDAVRVAHARAQLMLASERPVLDSYRNSLNELKALADKGFEDGDADWKRLQQRLLENHEQLVVATSRVLHIPS